MGRPNRPPKTRTGALLTGRGTKGVSWPPSAAARSVLADRLAEAGRRVTFGEWTEGACDVVVDGASVARLQSSDGGRFVLAMSEPLDIGRHSSVERAQAHVRRGIAAAIESGQWAVEPRP